MLFRRIYLFRRSHVFMINIFCKQSHVHKQINGMIRMRTSADDVSYHSHFAQSVRHRPQYGHILMGSSHLFVSFFSLFCSTCNVCIIQPCVKPLISTPIVVSFLKCENRIRFQWFVRWFPVFHFFFAKSIAARAMNNAYKCHR